MSSRSFRPILDGDHLESPRALVIDGCCCALAGVAGPPVTTVVAEGFEYRLDRVIVRTVAKPPAERLVQPSQRWPLTTDLLEHFDAAIAALPGSTGRIVSGVVQTAAEHGVPVWIGPDLVQHVLLGNRGPAPSVEFVGTLPPIEMLGLIEGVRDSGHQGWGQLDPTGLRLADLPVLHRLVYFSTDRRTRITYQPLLLGEHGTGVRSMLWGGDPYRDVAQRGTQIDGVFFDPATGRLIDVCGDGLEGLGVAPLALQYGVVRPEELVVRPRWTAPHGSRANLRALARCLVMALHRDSNRLVIPPTRIDVETGGPLVAILAEELPVGQHDAFIAALKDHSSPLWAVLEGALGVHLRDAVLSYAGRMTRRHRAPTRGAGAPVEADVEEIHRVRALQPSHWNGIEARPDGLPVAPATDGCGVSVVLDELTREAECAVVRYRHHGTTDAVEVLAWVNERRQCAWVGLDGDGHPVIPVK